MGNNKEIIIRIVLGFIFFAIVARILIPIFIDMLKGKSLGLSKDNGELDYLIKKQKESLKAQYRISEPVKTQSEVNSSSIEISKIKNEISWGGNQLAKDLKTKILKDFSYGFSDSKIAAFVTLVEKRNYLTYADDSDKVDYQSVLNFLTALFIFFVSIDEIKSKEINFIEKCAKKINVSNHALALSIQLKILMSLKDSNLKPERIFVENFVLHQYSDETIKKAVDSIIRTEANLWKKTVSSFFEELSLYLNFAQILVPIQRPTNKKDYSGAMKIFTANPDESFEEVKKVYKKMALQFHPDKIVPLKLPKPLESKAIEKFNIIQESFEIISERKK